MLVQYCYHSLFLIIDLILLRFIWRSSYTPILHFLLLIEQGLIAAPLFALIISKLFEGTADQNLAAHGLAWHGTFFLFASAALMYRQRRANGKRRRVIPSFILLIGCTYFAIVIDALLIEPTALVIRETTITTSKVSKPITIVFCSDLQADQVGDYERQTLQKIKEQNADLILFGGDYVQGKTEEMESELLKDWNRLFREVDLHAPLGVFAVQGNKEFFLPWKEMFVGTAIAPYDRTISNEIGEIRVTFLSIHDSMRACSCPDKKWQGQFRIMVGHMPGFAMADQQADLLLAGHTHGGQIQLPYFGPLITNAGKLPRRWASGITHLPDGGTLIVSHGSGMQRHPAPRIRFFCRPDFWVIHIVPGQQ